MCTAATQCQSPCALGPQSDRRAVPPAMAAALCPQPPEVFPHPPPPQVTVPVAAAGAPPTPRDGTSATNTLPHYSEWPFAAPRILQSDLHETVDKLVPESLPPAKSL